MPVYVTKYALTSGVIVCENPQFYPEYPTMVGVPKPNRPHSALLFHKPHWHEEEHEAVARVAWMVDRKLKSIEKARKKLKALTGGPKYVVFDENGKLVPR